MNRLAWRSALLLGLIQVASSCSKQEALDNKPTPATTQSQDKKVPIEDPQYGQPGICYFCGSNYSAGYLAGSSTDGGNSYDLFTAYPSTSYNVVNHIRYIYEQDPNPRYQTTRLTILDVSSRFTVPGSGPTASQDASPTNGDEFVQEGWSNDATEEEKRQGGSLIHISYHLVLNGATTGTRYMTIDERNGQRTVTF